MEGGKMVKNNIGVIVLVSAIVAVVTSIITGLIVANVNLSPPKTISDASGTINAHKWMADQSCEMNNANVAEQITVGAGRLFIHEDGVIKTNVDIPLQLVSGTDDILMSGIRVLDWSSTIDAYVCVSEDGVLFRSEGPCM